jgi:glycosyltransferase involved in cell wall biosynthesis
MRFFVVTPVLNGAGKIGRTIRSILAQTSVASGRDELRYLIMDGASTDATIEEARRAGEGRVEIRSESDTGLYDALARTLPLSDGDVTCYLGAGDVLDPAAFQIVGTIFQENPNVCWLTGRATSRNNRQEIVDSKLPHPFHRRFFECGIYGAGLPVLQQESTFWRTDLQATVDFKQLASTRLAGDYFLWKSFAQQTDLYVVNAILGSFTQEPGQLSVSGPKGAYRAELMRLRRPPSLIENLTAFMLRRLTRHLVPQRSAKRLFTYDFRREKWTMRRMDKQLGGNSN